MAVSSEEKILRVKNLEKLFTNYNVSNSMQLCICHSTISVCVLIKKVL